MNKQVQMLTCILLVQAMAGFGRQCGGIIREFHPLPNQALDHPYLSKTDARNFVTCGRECSLEPKCESFNFYTSSKRCELNNSTRTANPGALTNDQESVYFD